MNVRQLDERWKKLAASGGELGEGVTFALEEWVVPGEDALPVRVCKRSGLTMRYAAAPKSAIVLRHTGSFASFSPLMGGAPEDRPPKRHGAHFLIGRDGNAYQLAATEAVVHHSSVWDVPTISIEIDNVGALVEKGDALTTAYGEADAYCAKADKSAYVEQEFQGFKYWAAWTEAQYLCAGRLLKALCERHKIPPLLLPSPQRFGTFDATAREKFQGVCLRLNVEPPNGYDLGPFVDFDRLVKISGLKLGDAGIVVSGGTAPPEPEQVDPGTVRVTIGKRPGRIALAIHQGAQKPAAQASSSGAAASAPAGKRDDFLYAALACVGAPWKSGGRKPSEGLDGAGLIALALQRAGARAPSDPVPDAGALAAMAPIAGFDRHAPPAPILPGDLAWFGSAEHDEDATRFPLIHLGGGQVLGSWMGSPVRIVPISTIDLPFAGWAHLDVLGDGAIPDRFPPPPSGVRLSAALLPATPAARYDFLQGVVASLSGKWDAKGVNLVGVRDLADACQISPLQGGWNDTLFACFVDADQNKCCVELRASLDPGSQFDSAGSWHLAEGQVGLEPGAGAGVPEALLPTGTFKGWFDDNGQASLRIDDEPYGKGATNRETFEGVLKGPGGPLRKWPFRLWRGKQQVSKDDVPATPNPFDKGIWFSDGEGKFKFQDLKKGEYSLEVMVAAGDIGSFREQVPPGGSESGKRPPPPRSVPNRWSTDPEN